MKKLIMVAMALSSLCCGGAKDLTPEERAKLEPRLITFLTEEHPSAELDDVTLRPDGTRAYAVVVRCAVPEDLRAAGIAVRSVWGDVVTVSVSREELRRIVALPSVRWVEQGSKLELHQ